MTVIVKRGTIFDGSTTHKVGDPITGLSPEDEAELIKSGVAAAAGGELNFADLPGIEDLTSVEEFAKLKAEEQKELLESLEIEPATNAEGRVEQYKEWFEAQVSDNDEV